MLVSRWVIVAAAILASQTAEAQTLTLACKGAWSGGGPKPVPASIGIVVNLTTRTVQVGIGVPGQPTIATTSYHRSYHRYHHPPWSLPWISLWSKSTTYPYLHLPLRASAPSLHW
jgi:hypothetical protein